MDELLKQFIRLACFTVIVCFCVLQDYLGHIPCINVVFLDFSSVSEWIPMLAALAWSIVLIALNSKPRDAVLVLLLSTTALSCVFDKTPSNSVTHALVFISAILAGKLSLVIFRTVTVGVLWVLIFVLAFSSGWRLNTADSLYRGPRWTGLWDNPNEYGVLMGVGVLLAAGLLAMEFKREAEDRALTKEDNGKAKIGKANFLRYFCPLVTRKSAVLLLAAGVMAVGLVFSYSRGAWLGTAIGSLYLAMAYGKLKWRHVLVVAAIVGSIACLFWKTPSTSPWYFQRLDLSRGSVRHRLIAWKAGLQIMKNHPFGVGWNKTVKTYQEYYSPPDDGALAITTNDYIMLGTQLGWPGLVCFLVYTGLHLRKILDNSPAHRLRFACHAGAMAMLVGFWFDGGLFELATASLFWILLELGREDAMPKRSGAAELASSG